MIEVGKDADPERPIMETSPMGHAHPYTRSLAAHGCSAVWSCPWDDVLTTEQAIEARIGHPAKGGVFGFLLRLAMIGR